MDIESGDTDIRKSEKVRTLDDDGGSSDDENSEFGEAIPQAMLDFVTPSEEESSNGIVLGPKHVIQMLVDSSRKSKALPASVLCFSLLYSLLFYCFAILMFYLSVISSSAVLGMEENKEIRPQFAIRVYAVHAGTILGLMYIFIPIFLLTLMFLKKINSSKHLPVFGLLFLTFVATLFVVPVAIVAEITDTPMDRYCIAALIHVAVSGALNMVRDALLDEEKKDDEGKVIPNKKNQAISLLFWGIKVVIPAISILSGLERGGYIPKPTDGRNLMAAAIVFSLFSSPMTISYFPFIFPELYV